MINNKKSLLGRKVIVFGAGASMLAALTTGCGDSLSPTQKTALTDIKTSPAKVAQILEKIGKGVALDWDSKLKELCWSPGYLETAVDTSKTIVDSFFSKLTVFGAEVDGVGSDKVKNLDKAIAVLAKGGELEKLAKANFPTAIDGTKDSLAECNRGIVTILFIEKHQKEIYEKAASSDINKVDEAIKYLENLKGEFKTSKLKEGGSASATKFVEEPDASTLDIKAYSKEVLRLLKDLKGILENVADIQNKLEGKGSKGSTSEEKK